MKPRMSALFLAISLALASSPALARRPAAPPPGQAILNKVNQDLARQQVVDGQFEFKSGSATLTDGNEKRIQGLLRVINKHSEAITRAFPNFTVVAQGHTDSDGSATFNQTLSEQRAATVCAKLKEAGLAAQCVPRGFGESKPLVKERGPKEKQKNRRVIVQIGG